MPVNLDKPQNWKTDIAQSADMYNDWFMKFAPKALRETQIKTTKDVEQTLVSTANMTDIAPAILRNHPEVLPTLRMATCPPIAVDRLIGLAGVSPNLVKTMEKKQSIPPRMSTSALEQDLEKIGTIIEKMTDPDIFVWLGHEQAATDAELHRAATIVADRLCGAVSNPIIRNAQEQRQLAEIKSWLEARGYRELRSGEGTKFDAMPKGTFSFRLNVPVKLEGGQKIVNIPVDAIIKPLNSPPPHGHVVQFTYGGNLQEPARERDIPVTASALEKKWTRFLAAGVRAVSDVPTISDFFAIKRGLATGNNKYFILEEEDIAERDLPMECFKPILPSPRYLKVDEIRADDDGYPVIGKRLFLLDPDMAEEEIEKSYPSLWRYLEEGQAQGLHERCLCRHRSRWYAQEKRPPAPIVCTYLGRGDTKNGRPFRFILNESRATVANVYLTMYPTPLMERALNTNPKLIRPIWKALNRISAERLLGEGRVYGGGLHKLEPKELANVPVPEIAEISPEPLFRQREMNLQTVTD